MRDFPRFTRTAVISGLFPPQVNLYENFIVNFKRSLNLVFEACQADAGCNRRYPKFSETYFDVLNSLKTKPYRFRWGGEPFVLNAQDMQMIIHQLLYSRFTYGQIPSFVKSIQDGDDAALRQAIQTLSNRAQVINFAMNWSFQAHDEITFNTGDDLRANLEANPEMKPGPAYFMTDPDIMVNWHQHRAPAYVNEPVKSDIPAFLANGNFDPITPPANARAALKYLENAYYAEFPYDSHSVFGTCYFGMMEAFLDKPTEKPDMRCVERPQKVNWR